VFATAKSAGAAMHGGVAQVEIEVTAFVANS